jgi:hypothetical protein
MILLCGMGEGKVEWPPNGSEMSSADIPQQLSFIFPKPDTISDFRLPSASAPLSG